MTTFTHLKNELLLAKYELEQQLTGYSRADSTGGLLVVDDEKKQFIRKQIEQELCDVEAALAKFDNETYGFCENSGKKIPQWQLEIQPAARCADEPPALYIAHLKTE
ncbi:TraR/DksA family transcriptional regulator [Bacillus marinisedimentorum]|uniref:TraR/DksA family transcriptional regulator n=1 Tax=Bacillus marinisedimentorum TaxID=1821260 RepID=UPI0007DF2FEC|nr:hypothetical protein [Bacillus marinisedimentorum]